MNISNRYLVLVMNSFLWMLGILSHTYTSNTNTDPLRDWNVDVFVSPNTASLLRHWDLCGGHRAAVITLRDLEIEKVSRIRGNV